MFSCDSRRGFKNPVHERQKCHVPGMGIPHVIPRVGVRERTEHRFVFMQVCDMHRISMGYVISDHSSANEVMFT